MEFLHTLLKNNKPESICNVIVKSLLSAFVLNYLNFKMDIEEQESV